MIIGGLRDQKLQHRKAQKVQYAKQLSSNGPWIRVKHRKALMLFYTQQINLCFLKTQRTLARPLEDACFYIKSFLGI